MKKKFVRLFLEFDGRMLINLGNKVKKTMSKCHILERSLVTKPLLLSNDVIISPTEHAQQNWQLNQF